MTPSFTSFQCRFCSTAIRYSLHWLLPFPSDSYLHLSAFCFCFGSLPFSTLLTLLYTHCTFGQCCSSNWLCRCLCVIRSISTSQSVIHTQRHTNAVINYCHWRCTSSAALLCQPAIQQASCDDNGQTHRLSSDVQFLALRFAHARLI